MIAGSNKFTIISVFYARTENAPQGDSRCAEAAASFIECHGLSRADENGIKLMFSDIVLVFQSKIKKVQHSLETLVTLLDRVGIRSEVGCNDCGGHNHLECYKVGAWPSCLYCNECLEKIKMVIEDGARNGHQRAPMTKGQLLT